MKLLIVLTTVAAYVVAKPSYFHGPLTLAAAPVVTGPFEISSQYHAQDSLGQYSYGYSEPLSTKTESRTWDGITRGGYTYVDANGQVQRVQYTADAANGFRVSASNLPVAPESTTSQEAPTLVKDTDEVVKAREDHLAAVEEAQKQEEVKKQEEPEEKQEEPVEKSEESEEPEEVNSEEPEKEEEKSDDSSDGTATVPASTISVAAPVVSTFVQQPVSYYSYAALAPTLHYKAVIPAAVTSVSSVPTVSALHAIPALHAYSYAPILYRGLPLDTVSAHVKAKAHVFSARTIIH